MNATTQSSGTAGSLAALGAALGLGAIAAGGCCALPLAFAAIGAGGSWLGGLALLAPYRIYMLAGAGAVLAAAWFMALRRRAACSAEARSGACRVTAPRRTTYAALAVGTKLFVLGAAWPWIEPHLLAALGG